MKTIKISVSSSLLILMSCLLSAFSSLSQSHVTMSLANIKTTTNTIEYDLFITNDGTTNIKLSACSYGVDFNQAILNGGTITYTMLENSMDKELKGLSQYAKGFTQLNDKHQVRMTSTPIPYNNAPSLSMHKPLKIGRFRITNSQSWTANSEPEFQLHTTPISGFTSTQLIGYEETNRQLAILHLKAATLRVIVEESPILNPYNESPQLQSNNINSTINSEKPSSIETIAEEKYRIKIFPNPAENILNIELNALKACPVTIEILDMNGRRIKAVLLDVAQGLNNVSIEVSDINSGIYTIKISTKDLVLHSQTFLKQ